MNAAMASEAAKMSVRDTRHMDTKVIDVSDFKFGYMVTFHGSCCRRSIGPLPSCPPEANTLFYVKPHMEYGPHGVS